MSESDPDASALVQKALNFTSEFLHGMTKHKITEAFLYYLLESNGFAKSICLDETNFESLKCYFEHEVKLGDTVVILTYDAKLLAYNYEVARENHKISLN